MMIPTQFSIQRSQRDADPTNRIYWKYSAHVTGAKSKIKHKTR